MEFKQFGYQINIGSRTLIEISKDSIGVAYGKISLFADGEVVGVVQLSKAALDFLADGGKLKTKSVSQFKNEIK